MLTYFRALVIGLLQGVTELFPVSSLGHSVLFAAWFGWTDLVKAQSQGESFYLAFIVALHVATAAALFVYFRDEWFAIIGGLFRSARERRVVNADARIGLLLIVATIPAGITGLAFEHLLRTVFAKPLAAAIFLTINGAILAVGELLRRRAVRARAAAAQAGVDLNRDDVPKTNRKIESLSYGEVLIVGIAQVGALFAGISRSGITMVAGLTRGLDHEDAARFSFLLATPIIAAAGLYKVPDLLGPLGKGIHGQILVGAAAAAVAAYLSTRFLVRYFETKTLWPFAIYCAVFGIISIIHFG
jgi:undecaprenyl-diphosphatase